MPGYGAGPPPGWAFYGLLWAMIPIRREAGRAGEEGQEKDWKPKF